MKKSHLDWAKVSLKQANNLSTEEIASGVLNSFKESIVPLLLSKIISGVYLANETPPEGKKNISSITTFRIICINNGLDKGCAVLLPVETHEATEKEITEANEVLDEAINEVKQAEEMKNGTAH